MESKYKTRAKEILEKNHLTTCRECICNEEDWVKAMCQLAEEVEKSVQTRVIVDIYESIKQEKLYTKEQVEELLVKQRELSVNSISIWTTMITDYEDVKDSILNAKLKID